MRAVKDSEVAAESIGLDPVRVKTAAFVISAVCAGIAGALFAPLSTFVTPSTFTFSQSILFVLAVIIGGAGSVAGPLVGAAIVVLLPEALAALAEYRLLFFGGLLLVVLWAAPDWYRRCSRARASRAGTVAAPCAPAAAANFSANATPVELGVRGLGIAFGGLRAVSELDFSAKAAGAVTSLIGPNGAGKTTVLNMLGGFYRPDAGRIRLGERELQGAHAWRIARAGIARTYQTTQLFGTMSVARKSARRAAARRAGFAVARARGRGRRRGADARCSRLSAIPATSMRVQPTCRTSTNAWWRSRARLRRGRRCCCWTSRQRGCRARTRRGLRGCCGESPMPAWRWCWSNTTCRW